MLCHPALPSFLPSFLLPSFLPSFPTSTWLHLTGLIPAASPLVPLDWPLSLSRRRRTVVGSWGWELEIMKSLPGWALHWERRKTLENVPGGTALCKHFEFTSCAGAWLGKKKIRSDYGLTALLIHHEKWTSSSSPFSILSPEGTGWAEAWIQLAQFYTPGKSTIWTCNANFCLFQSTYYFKCLFMFSFVFSPLIFKDLEEDFSEIYQK